eukprot:gnl/TRDRNA2_/TRDRNA2_191534_c0_seq1.p1 gnl/TRDRNA2_/TRDRNA2_191534_c0~~gnl/TRDRNA2_/TRDRNA2_191534_c0_seq1.p1  ORF type:complete len:520 (+),score=83.67 gnl/TRDRNA2_/TRDRNA2_191534_c0_seq1:58-1617(+)
MGIRGIFLLPCLSLLCAVLADDSTDETSLVQLMNMPQPAVLGNSENASHAGNDGEVLRRIARGLQANDTENCKQEPGQLLQNPSLLMIHSNMSSAPASLSDSSSRIHYLWSMTAHVMHRMLSAPDRNIFRRKERQHFPQPIADNDKHDVNLVWEFDSGDHHFTPHEDVWAHNVGSISIFHSVDASEWCVLMGTIVCLLFFDWYFLQGLPDTPKIHGTAFLFWLCAGTAYATYYMFAHGEQDAIDWCIGYLLEFILSLDNLFVFHLVFKTYRTPSTQLHKALFFGIFGAVVFRIFFFLVLGALLSVAHIVRFIFGAFLIYSGFQALKDEDDEDFWVIDWLKAILGSRLRESYDEPEGKFFVVDEEGRTQATLLLFVVACLELTDLLFAVDSCSAKIAQIDNQYISYSSSILAIFGLRAMFFIIRDLVEYFELLKYGLCFILVFIGLELMASHWVHLSSSTVFFVIATVFAVCIVGSWAVKVKREKADSARSATGLNTGRSSLLKDAEEPPPTATPQKGDL